MKLIHPIYSHSDDRTLLESYNQVCGDPYNWFNTEYFRNENIYCFSFNFLIDWREHTLQRVAWIKRIISEDYCTDTREIIKAICRCDGADYLKAALKFCKVNGISLQYVLIPDIECDDWLDFNNKIIIFDATKYAEKTEESYVNEYSVTEFIQLIRSYKKDYHPIGQNKDKSGSQYRLSISSTSLEVFLSVPHDEIDYAGDTGFPGDADIILFDAQGIPKAVIELKKHDVGSTEIAGTIRDESMALYRLDSLKYDSLNILSATLNCPFYVLFFPITQEKLIKIESYIATGTYLHRCFANEYELPNCNEKPSLMRFFSNFRTLHLQCNEIKASYIFEEATEDDFCTAPSLTPFYCPNCGAPIRLSKKGFYYCFDFCGMNISKIYGQQIPKESCEMLLQGNEVAFNSNDNRSFTLLPQAVPNGQPYEGKQYYRWDKRYN